VISMRRSCGLLLSAARSGSSLLQKARSNGVPMVKLTRRALSDYVYRARMMDYYAQNDTAVTNEFPRAQFIVMLDKRALVRVDDETGETHLIVMGHDELKARLAEWGFELTLENSVFLDLQKAESRRTKEGIDEYEGVFGCSLRSIAVPPVGAPVSIDTIRKDMASSFGGRFIDLRKAMLVMREETERNRLSKLQTLSSWSSTYRRCPCCGGALRRRESKTAAECPPCRRHFYPTLSPVAITLIRDPADSHALLVRHRGSVPGVFTCVAGFALSGESLGECAKREVAEEVGLEASSIRQLDVSQPWPMPDSSLMIAHEAIASMDGKIQVCPDELEVARWFTRKEVAEALKKTEADPHLKGLPRDMTQRNELMFVPPQGAIAHRLIKEWVERKPSTRN
ncbi:hypothetical protein PFISCL1PPCAC_15805, partial [Pristionchus fissidentatus]